MKTKDKISAGRAVRTKYSGWIDELQKSRSNCRAAGHLMDPETILVEIAIAELQEKVHNIDVRLANLKREWEWEMDSDAAEANAKMNEVLMAVNPFFDSEPLAISAKMKSLVSEYADSEFTIEQERKNEIYKELKAHLKFMRQYKRK